MSLHAMPIIILNMGGEMLYILYQRLSAQNVDPEKSRQVISEVVKAMFDMSFMDELFRPQAVHSMVAVKGIFEKLAHSSLMRLNRSSMDKLFDLMAMGLKYQIINCSSPKEYLFLTLQHLYAIKNVSCQENKFPQGQALIEHAQQLLVDTYGTGPCRSTIQLRDLKHTLYDFVRDKKIKASLYLQKRLQNQDASFILRNDKVPLPHGTDKPGKVKIYEQGRQTQAYILSTDLRHAEGCYEARSLWNPDFYYGANVYSTNSSQLLTAGPIEDIETQQAIIGLLESSFSTLDGSSGGAYVGLRTPSKESDHKSTPLTPMSAKAESKLNAALFGSPPPSDRKAGGSGAGAKSSTPNPLATLSGFDSTAKESGGGGGSDASGLDDFESIELFIEEIDATAGAKTMASMLEEMNFHDGSDSKPDAKGGRSGSGGSIDSGGRERGRKGEEEEEEEESDDDLLALMDEAK